MKTINSLRSKLLALTLALMASVASFAYDEMPDFQVDGLYYNFLEGDNVEVTHPYRLEMPTEGTSTTATQDLYDDYAELTELTIPSTISYEGKVYNVIRIGHHAFDQCENLTSVDIPNSIKSIGIRAFSWCSALTSIVLKGGLENIESYAFEYCLGLENISLPNSLMTIGQNAFYNTQWYKNQPNGGVYVGNVFYKYKGDIPQNTSFVIKEGTVSISPYAFVKENYHEDYSLVSVSIPNSVKVIGEGVFYRCRALTSIVIPDEVTTIETLAFHYCKALNSVTCKAVEPPVLGSSVFSVVPLTDATLYVPAESVDAYKNADQWKDFGKILPIEPTSYKSQWCDTWTILMRTSSIYPPSSTPYRYQLAKDTVIGEHTYTACYIALENDQILDAPHYVAAVRFTDDRKVYIYYDNAEYLLYDFNVQEGDELEVFAGINNYRFGIKTYKCIVTGVEQYACIGCPATITLHVPNHPDDFTEIYRRTQWQEGVGDVYSGFLNGVNGYVPVDGGGSVHLLCAYQGDELKYTGDLYEEYGCGDDAEQSPEDLFPTLWGLQRTSCTKTIGEDEYGTVYGSRSTLMEIKQNMIIDGKQYVLFGDGQNYNSFLLREKGNKVFVYSSLLRKDLVLYDYTLEVGDSLPALYIDWQYHDAFHQPLPYNGEVVDYNKDYDGTILPADTFIVTNISTITLLDGKEHKKWTFNNGMQYVEGIGSYRTIYAENDFYQLIANVPQYSDADSTFLVCVSKNGQLLYQMDDAEMERLGAECLCDVEKKWSDTWCNQWNILSHGYQGPQDPLAAARTSIFWLSNNTVNRNGQEYIPLMCSSSLPNEESTLLVGELRFTEDKQVYFYYAFDETEYLLYDFGAELGDTLELFAGLEFYNYHKTYTHVITDKETLDDGRLQIQADVVIRIDNGAGEYFEEKHPVTWIEGLGSTYGIIFNSANPGVCGDAAVIMLCAYRDDECVYTTEHSDYKNMGCVYNDGTVDEDLFPMLSGLQRTVCNEYCEDSKTSLQKFEEIRFEHDQPYIYCYSAFLIREENNKILIYSHSLDKDLVLYDFTLEVGDSLPRLYLDESAENDLYWIYYDIMNVVDYHKDDAGNILPADTLIVTDVSAITLLDGKEYKKWTFNNGMEYVEGIGCFGNNNWSGDFFRLIGNMGIPACLHGEHLVCVSKNGQLLYQMDDTEMERLGTECLCDYNSGPKKDNAKNGKIGGRPTPTQWNMLEVETKEMDGTPTITRAETFSYTLENDSIVTKGKTFYQLARQSTKDTAMTKSFVGALHFGEDDDNRVYFLRDGVEYVLYDFTAEPGDTIEIFAGINNYPQDTTYTHVVTGKDTLENGACRMMLEVVFPDETSSVENAQKVWLAGLGSIDGIVHNAAQRTSDVHAAPRRSASSETQTSVMLCAWREDDCLYTTDHPDYDSYGCVYNLPTAVKNIDTHGTTTQKLIRNGQLLIFHEGKTYNAMGQEVK